MKTMTKTLIAALAFGGALVGAGAASAQPWGNPGYGNGYGGYGNGYRSPREQAAKDRFLVDTTCSGERGYNLEMRLRREVINGQINGWTARRIQTAIDRLQDQERHECRERDFYSARDIGKQYVQLRAWIDEESGRYASAYYRR